jgi:hypothetical protein
VTFPRVQYELSDFDGDNFTARVSIKINTVRYLHQVMIDIPMNEHNRVDFQQFEKKIKHLVLDNPAQRPHLLREIQKDLLGRHPMGFL